VPIPGLLRDLLTAPGPSGREHAPARVWRDAAAAFADVSTDTLGSSVARVAGTGGGPLLALVGHIDEIGFVVTYVSDEGYLRVRPLGGWNPQVLHGQRVELLTRHGPVQAVVGKDWAGPPKPGEARKALELEHLHLDIGARDRAEAEESVRVGDVGVIAAEPVERRSPRRRRGSRARGPPSTRSSRTWPSSST
jgi:putative aminopeptidase FrvX